MAHLMLVQLQGMSKPIDKGSGGEKYVPFFPNFLLRDLMVWLMLLGIVVSLSFYLPAELGVKADPFAPTPVGIKPEWYFLFMFQALKLFPGHVLFLDGEVAALGMFGLIGLIIFLIPFLDVRASRGEKNNWISLACLVLLLAIISLTLWGMFSTPGAT